MNFPRFHHACRAGLGALSLGAALACAPVHAQTAAPAGDGSASSAQGEHEQLLALVKDASFDNGSMARIFGKGFARLDKTPVDVPADWVAAWYWAGTWVRSATVQPLQVGDVIRGATVNMPGFVLVSHDDWRKATALAMCPPEHATDPKACAYPRTYVIRVDDWQRNLEVVSTTVDSAEALASYRGSPVQLKVVSASEREAVLRTTRARLDAGAAVERDRVHGQQVAIAAHAAEIDQRDKARDAYLLSARRGTTLFCDSGTSMLTAGKGLDRIGFSCNFPNVGKAPIDLPSLLNGGWAIESQSNSAGRSVLGEEGSTVALVLRKT